jgi:hypothetical protein
MVTKLDPAKRLALMDKLLPAIREELARLGALVDELEACTGGNATVGEKLKDVEQHFGELWQERYHEPYAWDYVKTRGQLKTLFRKLPVEIIKGRVSKYLANNEPFFADRRHPFGLFVSTVNQHVVPHEQGLLVRPTGCKHDPPCRDQVAHTKKRLAEQTT